MIKHTLISLGVFLGIFSISAIPVRASIATIGKTGDVVVNVLSAQDDGDGGPQTESLKVSKSSVEMGEADVPISLFRKDNKYLLNITGKNGEKSFDVTDYQNSILEIEERPSVKKLSISLSGNQFVIEQAGIKARTYYQINVEPKNSKITILTPTGYKFLSMLPWDAVNILIRSKSITTLGNDKTVDISEDMNGNLFYTISGIKQIGIKDVFMYDAPVSAKISVVNGEVLEVNQPMWLKLISLFTVQT